MTDEEKLAAEMNQDVNFMAMETTIRCLTQENDALRTDIEKLSLAGKSMSQAIMIVTDRDWYFQEANDWNVACDILKMSLPK